MTRVRVPIRLQQAPAFVRQMAQRRHVLRRPLQRQPVFRLCYFSCQSYFSYLYCALHSLLRSAPHVRYEVLVFSDNDMPLSPAQTEQLQRLMPNLRVVPWPKSMGWGAEQIGWIWRAYALAAEGLHDDDVVARVDSDVFFFNDRIFQAVARSSAAMVGDGHFVDFAYCQGGCYFLRASAVRAVLALIEREPLETFLAERKIPVEDIAATALVQAAGLPIWQTWFMMFPDELRNAGGLTAWQRRKFSCLHFVMKNKAVMLETYERELLLADDRPAYQQALATA
ncbi:MULTISPECIES: hypothetical protein [Aquincola]|uniref:hypothetical protein n=1 Tax=Aquincola TaxID=391952 RepID=UPI000614A51E|nr:MULTISPECIES: hypothetical protein [Aquincola]MCR5866052.1 hypothetical protein [Aquincola sp. J276]